MATQNHIHCVVRKRGIVSWMVLKKALYLTRTSSLNYMYAMIGMREQVSNGCFALYQEAQNRNVPRVALQKPQEHKCKGVPCTSTPERFQSIDMVEVWEKNTIITDFFMNLALIDDLPWARPMWLSPKFCVCDSHPWLRHHFHLVPWKELVILLLTAVWKEWVFLPWQ